MSTNQTLSYVREKISVILVEQKRGLDFLYNSF